MEYDFDKIKNVFVFGSGVSAGQNMALGGTLLKDVFRLYHLPNRKTTPDESHFYSGMYIQVMKWCKYFYNIDTNEINVRDFERVLNIKKIDFEDYFSRYFLLKTSPLLTTDNKNEGVDYNLLRLLYWYFWHHASEWKDTIEFTGKKDFEYINIFLNKLNNKSAILTTNYDLVLERIDNKKLYNIEDLKVVYDPNWIKSDEQILYLKLHGSINWVESFSFKDSFILEEDNGNKKRVQKGELPVLKSSINDEDHILILNTYYRDTYSKPTIKPVIIPPTIYKGVNSNNTIERLLKDVWKNANKCLLKADKIIFAGLSLRDTDLLLQTFLKQALNNNKKKPKIYLNLLPGDESITEKYKLLFSNTIKPYYKDFQQFVRDDLDSILSE